MNRVLFFVLILVTGYALAENARPPITVYANPAEDPDLTIEQRTNIINAWLFCAECPPSDVRRVSAFGNDALEVLGKAYKGNTRFLNVDERAAALSRAYDNFSAHLTVSSSKDAFVKRELLKLKNSVQHRAETALRAIGTPEALAIVDGPIPREPNNP